MAKASKVLEAGKSPKRAFIIDDTTRLRLIQQDPRSADIIKPTLQGKDLRPYHSRQEKWLINSHNGLRAEGISPIDVERDYPAIFQHLTAFLPKIAVRADQGNHWSNLRSCAFLLDFEKPKLVWGELSDTAKFSYDAEAHYAEASTFIMVGQHLKYLLAVLNSYVASWYFDQITTTSGVGTTRWKKYKIQQLPVPEPDSEIKENIERLVDAVQVKKRDGNDTAEEEAKTNALIFKAYGFIDAESDYILSAQGVDAKNRDLIAKHLGSL